MPGVMQVQKPQGTSIGGLAQGALQAYGAYKDFTKPSAPQQPQGTPDAAPAPPVDLNAGSTNSHGAIDRRIKMTGANPNAMRGGY